MFQILEILWISIAAIIFLRDVHVGFKVGEIRPFEFCVITINIYITIKIVSTCITLF